MAMAFKSANSCRTLAPCLLTVAASALSLKATIRRDRLESAEELAERSDEAPPQAAASTRTSKTRFMCGNSFGGRIREGVCRIRPGSDIGRLTSYTAAL